MHRGGLLGLLKLIRGTTKKRRRGITKPAPDRQKRRRAHKAERQARKRQRVQK